MATAARVRIGWALAGLSAGLVGLWLVLGGLGQVGHDGLRTFLENEYGNIVFGLLFPVVGALLLARGTGHRLGWLYSLAGLACSITLAAYAYAQRGLVEQPGSLPGALPAAWVSSWVWMFGFSALVTLGVLGFPDGRLPGKRWWPVAAVAAMTLGLGVVAVATRPGPLENHPSRDNPFGLAALRASDEVIEAGWLPLLTVVIVASFAGLLVRYRRGSAAERAQLRWLVVAIGLLIMSFAIPAGSSVGFVGNLLVLVSVPLFPTAVGVAALRSRVDDPAGALRRSLVYGWLIAAELAVYAAIVLVLDAALRGHAQPVAALIGAGAVAVLYQPLRLRLQRATEQMLYGDRGDPDLISRRLSRELESGGSTAQAMSASVTVIGEELRLPYVALAMADDSRSAFVAEHGSAEDVLLMSFPLMYGGDTVGRLIVGHRSTGPMNSVERDLLADLARQIAVVAHAGRLERALGSSLDRLVVAREEERLRIRRDLHDGLGPALAGVALGVDAARNIMSADREAADDLLCELKNETLGCVTEVRRLVDNLRPPQLDAAGLVPALRSFAARLSDRDPALSVDVDAATPLSALPEAVEAAAYRIATEALTNVARHSKAHRCRLRVDVTDEVTVQIWDDGVGIHADHPAGVGLSSMTARATELGGHFTIGPAKGGGTRVVARLPVMTS